ncbi:hypothetical protein DSM104299_05527 [Baekduia alba]|nr:hypothetical protein DSM104299_05527 [Baekduia alba]
MVLLCALLGALALTTTTASAGVSKQCKLLSPADVGRPVGMKHLSLRGVTTSNPSLTGVKGRLVLCDFRYPSTGTVASSSVATLPSAGAARKEFSAQVHREQRQPGLKTRKLSGPWDDAYWLGHDGILVLKGRYIFHLQYADGLAKFSAVTQGVLSGLGAKAARRL